MVGYVRTACYLFTIAALAAIPITASAQSESELAVARQLYDEGYDAAKRKDWNTALARFQEARKITDNARLNLFVATALRELGRPLAAFGAFDAAIAKARAEGKTDIVDVATARRAEVAAELGSITISPDKAYPGLHVSLDGQRIALAATDRRMPVLVGDHRVEARAPSFKSFSYPFTVRASEERTVVIRLIPAPATQVAPAKMAPAGAAPVISPARSAPDSSSQRSPALGVTLVAVGVAGIGVGIGFSADALSTYQAAKDEQSLHNGVVVDADLVSHYQTSGLIGGVAGGLGVVATAVGGYLLHGIYSAETPSQTRWRLVPQSTGRAHGMAFVASF